MEQITDAMQMVDHLPHPAFCVRDGIIVKVNPAAAARTIEVGTVVSKLLQTGQEEYSELNHGCLYLTLSVCGAPCGASVSRKPDFDLFELQPESEQRDFQIMALAARELREPLTGMMISAERMLPLVQSQSDEAREQLSQLSRSLYQMLRIVSNMSDANRFAADTGTRQELRDVCGIIREVVTKAASMAESCGIRMEHDIHPEAVYTPADAEKLERAVYNMLSNALKFTPKGGLVQVSLTKRGNKLYFSVRDDGCGIAEALRSGVFSRYTREPGLEDGRHGIGLGLVLIRSAAALHGGTVLVDAPDKSGTRVTMSMAIRSGIGHELRSPVLKVDYAGEHDHALLELADVLPASSYAHE